MVRKGHHRIIALSRRVRYAWKLSGVAVVAVTVFSGCGVSVHDAVSAGDAARVREMLERAPGAIESRDNLGKTPLFFAVTYGREEMVDLLIDQGADVNAQDHTGLTPLHVAAFMSRPACAQRLLKAGARIDATDAFGDTPLHSAAMHGMTGMIGFLARRGADVNATNKEGETPLDLAVKYEQERAVQTLRNLLKPPA